jgi:4-amino-4-deoxy-L-arabinose transferase-like glycosyltransferase
MKHLMYLAIGALIFALAIGFIVGLGYLAKTFGVLIVFIPLILAMFYALGRSFYESMR